MAQLSSDRHAIPHLSRILGVFWLTLWLNLLVAFIKLLLGYMTGTLALIADGYHSVLDASANVAGIISLKIAAQPPDSDHPYGHRKFEAIGSMVISFFLFLASFNIFQEAVGRFFNPAAHTPVTTWWNYLAVGLSFAISLWVSRYENRKGREYQSELLVADSKHTLSDVYNSASVLIALLAIHFNLAWVDSLVALMIVVFIFRAGFQIIMIHLGALVDEVVVAPQRVEALVLDVPGVISCHKIRSRGMKNHVFIDLHIQVDPRLTVEEAHRIAYAVEDKLKDIDEVNVVDVLVHVEEAHA